MTKRRYRVLELRLAVESWDSDDWFRAGLDLDLETVSSLDAALEAMGEVDFDVVLLSALPERASIPAALRAAGCQAPILAQAGSDDEAEMWLRNGATDVWNPRVGGAEPLKRALRYAALTSPSSAGESRELQLTKTLLAHFPNGSIYLLDRDGRILLANGLGLAPLELTAEMVQNKTLHEVFGRDEIYPAWERAFLHALEGGEYFLEGQIRGRWRAIRSVPIRDKAGEITGVLTMTQDITDRKRAEEALGHSEARFRAFMDNIPSPIFIVDEEGRYVFLNRATEKQVGRTSEELLGGTVFDRLPPEIASGLKANTEAVLRENRALEFDETVFDAEGNTREQIVVKFPLRDVDGKRYVAGVALDITERKRAEAALRKSESRLARAQAMAHLGHINGQRGSQEIEWSDEVFRIFGYEPQAFVPTFAKLTTLIHPDDREMWREQLRKRDSTRLAVDYQLRLLRTDGGIRWAHIHNEPVLNETGEVVGFEGTVLDITHIHNLEDQVDRFFTLAEDIFCICDFEGRVSYLNPAWEKTLGHIGSETLGRRILDYVHPDDLDRTKEEIRKGLTGDWSPYFENRCLCHDGGVKWIRWGTALDRSNKLIYAVGSDITAQKESEAALLRVRDDLESRVAERTQQLQFLNQSLQGEIAERRQAMMTLRHFVHDLEVARDEAQRANAAKSDFLSRMSHELRTPMNSILGFAQLMEMSPSSPKHGQRVASILTAGQHLLHLINDVLDLSRVESGRLQLAPESISAGSAIERAVDLIRPLAEQKQISVTHHEVSDGSHPVLADPQRLSQILLNLLSNATKYNRFGGRVEITCDPVEGGKLRISVRDTGPGIATGDLPRLFAPFERLNAHRNEAEGTGLGLALSKGLAEAMGGTLGVDSELGIGSTFWFELPSAEAGAHYLGDTPAEDLVDLGERQTTVLYVEDSLVNYHVMEDLLENHSNILLVGAFDGLQGLESARKHAPSLILLDLHLPDISGEEVLRRLREDEATRHTPVVIVSADATPATIDRLLNAGAADYVTKPLDIRRLMRVIQRTLTPDEPAVLA